jgi:putative DNA primase/helicase
MKPSGPIVEAAIREFGEPNWRLSSARELRFGRRGSVSVNVDDGVYFDFEADQGGTVEMPREITVEPEPRVITAYYDYVNEHGEPVMQVVRYQPKDFRQRRRVDGKWVWNVKGVELVPYRLPEVIAANEVVIVEGEKDVETLCALVRLRKLQADGLREVAGRTITLVCRQGRAGPRRC